MADPIAASDATGSEPTTEARSCTASGCTRQRAERWITPPAREERRLVCRSTSHPTTRLLSPSADAKRSSGISAGRATRSHWVGSPGCRWPTSLSRKASSCNDDALLFVAGAGC